MMDLSEDLIKLIQIGILVVGTLALYFSYINYNISVETGEAQREAIIMGNSLLSSNCLGSTRSVFDEDNLASAQSDPNCLRKSYSSGHIDVELADKSNKWSIEMGTGTTIQGQADFSVLVNTDSGLKTATMTVKT